MRRTLLTCLSFLGAAAPAAAAVMTAPAPRTSLENLVCQRAANPLDRAIGVTAVMHSMTGTKRMQMKFILLRRQAPGSPPTAVHGGDLGHWLNPKPATLGQRPSDVWKLKKLVVNLVAPSAYRFRVWFRWMDASGTTIQHTTLLSGACSQPG